MTTTTWQRFTAITWTREALYYLFLLSIQFGLQPILTKAFASKDNVFKITLVGACEFFKLLFSIASLLLTGKFSLVKEWYSTVTIFQPSFVIAFIYSIQNILVQVSYRNLSALVFNLVNQSKIIWCAFFLYIVLNKKQSRIQLIALSLMMIASIILSTGKQTNRATTSSFILGFVPVFIASVMSGLASSLSERVLITKNSSLYSLELSLFSLLQLPFLIPFTEDLSKIQENGLFSGWTLYTLIPVLTNAAGGIVVGLVTKHAGSVNKGFALIVGVILSAIFQYILFDVPVNMETWIAIPMVFASIYLHSAFPNVPNTEEYKKKT